MQAKEGHTERGHLTFKGVGDDNLGHGLLSQLSHQGPGFNYNKEHIIASYPDANTMADNLGHVHVK